MRLKIFWRVILAQVVLIILILMVSLYALSQLNWLTRLSTNILTIDASAIEEEKQLLRIFLTQMRHAEKYLLLKDNVFYKRFVQSQGDFESTLAQVATLLDTSAENARLTQIRTQHARYGAILETALTRMSVWAREKSALSDGIIEGLNDLIRMREAAIAHKTAATRDRSAVASRMVGWLTVGSIGVALFLSYFHARGISQPLKKLTQALLRLGQGEFHRSLHIRGPKEVQVLARAFNWMAGRLAELDRMKTDFMAHVSHELRTPLTGIQEGTALLLEDTPDPITVPQREILEIVRDNGERLAHSISAILDLAKMEAGMMEYLQAPCDLIALMNRSVRTIRLMARKKRIRLDLTCNALPLLSVDETRIQQVLNNLLSNAVKFTPEGGTITISADVQPAFNGRRPYMEIKVSDTGVGIAASEVEWIFDRFYQSPEGRGANSHGTGLGLAIAWHIVEAHGGKIWAESRVGEGSTFVFTLPLHDSAKMANVELADGSGV